MHADFKELLSLRDGEPVAAQVTLHLSACAHCQAELRRLEELQRSLQRLPRFTPPPQVWNAIRAQLDWASPRRASPRRAAPRRRHYAAWGAAATVLIVLSLAFLQEKLPAARQRIAERGQEAPETLGRVVARSQQLEDLLQRLPPRPAVERAATSAAIDDLQSRIQVLDLQLGMAAASESDHDHVRRLWDTRVHLLHSLIDVRYAESLRDADGGGTSLYSGVI